MMVPSILFGNTLVFRTVHGRCSISLTKVKSVPQLGCKASPSPTVSFCAQVWRLRPLKNTAELWKNKKIAPKLGTRLFLSTGRLG